MYTLFNEVGLPHHHYRALSIMVVSLITTPSVKERTLPSPASHNIFFINLEVKLGKTLK